MSLTFARQESTSSLPLLIPTTFQHFVVFESSIRILEPSSSRTAVLNLGLVLGLVHLVEQSPGRCEGVASSCVGTSLTMHLHETWNQIINGRLFHGHGQDVLGDAGIGVQTSFEQEDSFALGGLDHIGKLERRRGRIFRRFNIVKVLTLPMTETMLGSTLTLKTKRIRA